MPSVTVAVVGCSHGEMDKIYETLEDIMAREGRQVDLLLCCGDFQAVRNFGDLHCMHVPDKYKSIQTFYKYYSGITKAPVLTLFVGGNHEASNHLSELFNGGWVAPNIYYMGHASVLNYKGLRIGGLSGIYGKNTQEYHTGHWECPPYNNSSKVSSYHVRNVDIFRLKQLASAASSSVNNQNPQSSATTNQISETAPLDIFLSHDWPNGIHANGDTDWLLRRKQHFQPDVAANKLGNPYTMQLLNQLQPSYWFSAHLHVKFPAIVQHPPTGRRQTRFLALDKCLPRRGFMQLIDVEVPEERASENWLSYDPEWLAILQSTDHLLNSTKSVRYMPGPGMGSTERYQFTPSAEELARARSAFPDGDLTVPSNFVVTAPPYVEGGQRRNVDAFYCVNPQTKEFCDRLGISNLNEILYDRRNPALGAQQKPPTSSITSSSNCSSSSSSGFPRSNVRTNNNDHSDDDDDDLFSGFENAESSSSSSSSTMFSSRLRIPPPMSNTTSTISSAAVGSSLSSALKLPPPSSLSSSSSLSGTTSGLKLPAPSSTSSGLLIEDPNEINLDDDEDDEGEEIDKKGGQLESAGAEALSFSNTVAAGKRSQPSENDQQNAGGTGGAMAKFKRRNVAAYQPEEDPTSTNKVDDDDGLDPGLTDEIVRFDSVGPSSTTAFARMKRRNAPIYDDPE